MSDLSSIPPMSIRAISCDLARSQRADARALKRIIHNAAECGFNMCCLYLEHRFAFPSCPGIAPPGSLTPDLARELVQVGEACGVRVVPGVNLLGHCEGLAATERYAHLAVDPFEQSPWGGYEQLNLELPEARALIARMLKDVCDAFPGDWLYLGCDEVRQTGRLFPDDPSRRAQALREHMAHVIDLGRATGRRLLVAADMPKRHPDLRPALPRDIVLLDWYYGTDPADPRLRELPAAGFTTMAVPTIDSHSGFSTRPRDSAANLALMVGQARELSLCGFMVTTWEFGCGISVDLAWPWLALAGQLADGPVEDPCCFVSDFATRRYGIDGADFWRLHEILGEEVAEAVGNPGRAPVLFARLRKSLFRAADPFSAPARPSKSAPNHHQALWEPSPFHTWLLLRPVLTESCLVRLESLATEAAVLRERLAGSCTAHAEELTPLLSMAEALQIITERLRLIDAAKAAYHQASLAQGSDGATFQAAMEQTMARLAELRPGLRRLREIVKRLDATVGLDPGEYQWLDVHEQSLNEHLDALSHRKPQDDSLLEFGEFLRRPANVAPRLTWR